jgi:hypothetical protein
MSLRGEREEGALAASECWMCCSTALLTHLDTSHPGLIMDVSKYVCDSCMKRG